MLGQDDRPEQGLVELLRPICSASRRRCPMRSASRTTTAPPRPPHCSSAAAFLTDHDSRAEVWARKGRHWLEERAKTLIEPDGSFQSVFGDLSPGDAGHYAIAEAWRQPSSPACVFRPVVRGDWARRRVGSGNNRPGNRRRAEHRRERRGSADATQRQRLPRFPSLRSAGGRAFRREADAFGPGPWTARLRWLDIAGGQPVAPPKSTSFDADGYHVLRRERAIGGVALPAEFRFRPSQADALHLDLWANGMQNLLRDAGTFSYNADGAEWFSGTSAHNTITNSTGRIRCLAWAVSVRRLAEVSPVEPVSDDGFTSSAAAAYTDACGARHDRGVHPWRRCYDSRDTISGNFEEACLRWRLSPGEWRNEGNTIRSQACSITIEIDGVPVNPTLSTTIKSRYYQHKAEIPEVSVKVNGPVNFITRVTF